MKAPPLHYFKVEPGDLGSDSSGSAHPVSGRFASASKTNVWTTGVLISAHALACPAWLLDKVNASWLALTVE
jgi:hypothetical protein